jgi:hypothetical protein
MRRMERKVIRRVEKKKDLHNKQLRVIGEKNKRKMDEIDRLRIYGMSKKSNVSFNELAKQVKIPKTPIAAYPINDYGKYVKTENVDYDTIVYISTYNRYEKLINILNQLYSQKTKYSFKVILMNDGSTDERYNNIENKFPDVLYLKNDVNGGLDFYWKTINTIFQEIRKYCAHAVIQIDDDFILCNEFINRSMNKFFQIKEENNSYMGIRYHLTSFKENQVFDEGRFDAIKRFQDFDGGSIFDSQFLQLFNYELVPDENNSHLWYLLNALVKKFGVLVYTMRESLAYHTGNDDSKLNPEIRKAKKLYTINFIKDVSKFDTK